MMRHKEGNGDHDDHEGQEETTPLVSSNPSSSALSVSSTSSPLEFQSLPRDSPPTLLGYKVYSLISRLIGLCTRRDNASAGASSGLGAVQTASTIKSIEEEAWNYFEKIRLPRRAAVLQDSSSHQIRYRKAEPGTPGSTLYPAWTTPMSDLPDFGTGVAVYFATLRASAVLCFVAGILYLPTMKYYHSSQYGPAADEYSTNLALQTSMMCPSTQWVPCPTCTREEWSDNLGRIATALKDDGSSSLIPTSLYFVLETTCAPLRWQEGVNHMLVVCFLFIGLIRLGRYQQQMELETDEAVLTASDYTIQVDNPPQVGSASYDPKDPTIWKSFFEQFGPVAYVTIALNNSNLCSALARRRALLQEAGYPNGCIPPPPPSIEDSTDSIDQGYGKLPRASNGPLPGPGSILAKTKPKLYQKILDATAKCHGLLQNSYDISAVFVTFDTEKAQRAALRDLMVGQVHVATNNVSILSPHHVFQNVVVLDVMETVEPSAIRWQDLDESMFTRVRERVCNAILSFALIAAGFTLVEWSFLHSVDVAAIVITLLNITVPHIFKAMNRLESHQTEDGYQSSLYFKICIFRWVNTAIVTILIKPSTGTLTNSKEGLITAVYAILKAELMIAPVIHMLDIAQNVRRHIVSRFAARQTSLTDASTIYRHFAGSNQNLGEKYTNLTKTLFITFLYSVIFPAGFFLASAALYTTYLTDKFLLVRAWGPIPQMGNKVAQWSRRVFFPLCLVTLCLTSEFFWSAFPFDDVCDTDEVVTAGGGDVQANGAAYLGTHTVVRLNELDLYKAGVQSTTLEQITVAEGADIKRFCDQDFLERFSALIHVLKSNDTSAEDWMSSDQILFTKVFGVSCVLILIGFAVWRLWVDCAPSMKEAVLGGFTTEERDSGERFCDQPKISAYVPSVNHRNFIYPLLACDVQAMDAQHIGWMDPINSHEYYNLARDVDAIRNGAVDQNSAVSSVEPALSIIAHWPSNTKKRS